MSYQSRAFDLINTITGNPIDGSGGDGEIRIIDSFFLKRNDLTNRLEFVADKSNPTEEEKARVMIEAFRQFGEITVAEQAKLTKENELETDFVTAETNAIEDFSEVG